MKSTKTFNNISDKLRAQIPKLKPGETVTFQMLHGTPNPEPDEKERSKAPVLYGKRQVLTTFRIFDKYQTDEAKNEVGGYVDIGCVDGWIGDRPERYRCFVPGQGQYSQFQGKFSLSGGNVKDEELYEILYLSPEREGSPCLDSSVEILFKIIDLKGESTATFNKVSRLRKALELTKDISEEKARQVMAALNQPSYQDKDVLMAKVGELARDKYEQFIKAYESEETPILAEIRKALDMGVLNHSMTTGTLTLGDVKLTTLKVDSPDVLVPEVVRWLDSAENGKDVLANIKKQIAGVPKATK